MGLFTGVQAARASYAKDYMRAGHYLALIEQIKIGENRNKRSNFVIKMTCLHAFAGGPATAEGEPHRPGESMSDCISQEQADFFLPKIKSALMAILGLSESEVTEDICNEVTSDAQPLKGLVIELQGTTIVTKGNKKTIVVVDHRGQFPVSRLKTTLDPQVAATYFPNGFDALEARQADLGVAQV